MTYVEIEKDSDEWIIGCMGYYWDMKPTLSPELFAPLKRLLWPQACRVPNHPSL